MKGSSPLARGTPLRSYIINHPGGLIPARAGNTAAHSQAVQPGRAHPRSRGEHQDGHTPVGTVEGSSPLARGTLFSGKPRAATRGLIPARAGNTLELTRRRTPGWAHPRSRGEHFWNTRASGVFPGSSPLARGTLNNTIEYRREPVAHPRSRGEHDRAEPFGVSLLGSSPLARGTHP